MYIKFKKSILRDVVMNSTTKPRVFVSYSWDSDSHIENVKRFVQDLRSSGINVGYDGDLG